MLKRSKANPENNPQAKNTRQNYSPRKLKIAIAEVHEGKLPVAQISRRYNIPRSTLIAKSTGKRPETYRRPGPQALLGEDVETKICEWLIQCAKSGFPINKNGLQFTVKQILKDNPALLSEAGPQFGENGPGRKWTESFFNRHPELSIRIPEYLHGGRASVSESKIRKWFEEVKDTLGTDMDIFKDPHRVFNSDETAIFLNPQCGPVIAAKGQRYVYKTGQCNKENLTILITANAAGELAPPLALFSFERIPTAIAAVAPKHWGIGRSPKGWMNSECFFEYMTNVFNKFIEEQKIPKPVVFFVDGHKSHLSLQLSEFCKNEGIILISLPPNATHMMQPLDVALFAPLKRKWKNYLEKYKLVSVIESYISSGKTKSWNAIPFLKFYRIIQSSKLVDVSQTSTVTLPWNTMDFF